VISPSPLPLSQRERGEIIVALSVSIKASIERSRPVRPDVTLFNSVRLASQLHGVSREQGNTLIEAFKRR